MNEERWTIKSIHLQNSPLPTSLLSLPVSWQMDKVLMVKNWGWTEGYRRCHHLSSACSLLLVHRAMACIHLDGRDKPFSQPGVTESEACYYTRGLTSDSHSVHKVNRRPTHVAICFTLAFVTSRRSRDILRKENRVKS